MIQLTLTLKMTTVQVVEMSVTVNNNSPIQDYVHPDDQTQPAFEVTLGFKPFTVDKLCVQCPSIYESNNYNVKFALLQLPINDFKTRRHAFCPLY